MSQRDRILAHLKSGKPLTGLEALDRFGCFRLAARIGELRESGYRIERTWVQKGDKRYARYALKN